MCREVPPFATQSKSIVAGSVLFLQGLVRHFTFWNGTFASFPASIYLGTYFFCSSILFPMFLFSCLRLDAVILLVQVCFCLFHVLFLFPKAQDNDEDGDEDEECD